MALTACHSKKNIASSVSADTNTIVTTDMHFQSARLDSVFSSMAIELDSFDITAEPVVITPCPDSASNRSAVIAYRYQIKANSATVKGEKKAVSRAYADTLQQDSIALKHLHSSTSSELSDTISVYEPPDMTWLFLSLGLIIIVLIVIRQYLG